MEKKRDRVLSALSLAAKAGQIKSGEFQTETAIKDGSARLVLLATDASENTKKKFRDACAFGRVPLVEYADREALGHCIGRDFRATAAVTDASFAKMLSQAFQNEDQTGTERNRGVKTEVAK